jgi:hypothetical protein
MERPFQIGDMVRVSRIPPHILVPDYSAETRRAFEAALGRTYRVESIDWGGWVWLHLGADHNHEEIGIQPDCVVLVKANQSEDSK